MQAAKMVYLYLFDTLADWEIGYVTTGISNPMMQLDPERYRLRTFSTDGKPIRTLGGLRVTPELSLEEVQAVDAKMLILPGGMNWETGGNQEALALARHFHGRDITVAGICGATLGLATVGVLDGVRHTSNSRDFLRISDYRGEENYVAELVVSDGGVITAPGTAALEFAREIFRALDLYKPDVLDAWYTLFKTSSPEAYAALMKAAGA